MMWTRVGLGNFPSELISVVAAQLPWHNRAPTLLSLALTSHYLCNVIIPHILFTHVRLVGEDEAAPVVADFIDAMTRTLIRNDSTMIPYSHYIQHLYIHGNSTASDDDDELKHELTLLELQIQRMIDFDGLPNLVSLTIHRDYRSDAPLSNGFWFWNDIRKHCPNFQGLHVTGLMQDHDSEWIPSTPVGIAKIIRLAGSDSFTFKGNEKHSTPRHVTGPGPFNFNFSKLPVNLHTLELRMSGREGHSVDAKRLLSTIMPDLHVLILNWVEVVDPSMTKEFWKKHPHLERLELWRHVSDRWFDGFEAGMLPNLTVLKCDSVSARILLPHIAESLVNLCLWGTYNAQAPYLLRTVPKGGILPALRSLGIQRDTGNWLSDDYEGHRWQEDENGTVTEAPWRNEARQFDGNYIMSIAKAAPNLEELELMGTSDDAIDSITSALCRLPKLSHLILSGPIDGLNMPFFESCRNWMEYAYFRFTIPAEALEKYAYAPLSFDQAACDLARGCPTLETVTFGDMIGDLRIEPGVSGRILRDGTDVKVRRIKAWGRSIGIEEDW
ncbi:hypothetical protein H0H93_007884 [Arthromyces matolae]|nr:hypothetical protein H0H93_007884 [Arthromyces matolae]